MADRLSSNRRPSGSRQEPSRRARSRDYQDTADSRDVRDRRDRREQMIHCDRCGEDYSATYRRCPFCDERTNGGKRQSNRRGGGYGAPVNPAQVAAVVIGLVIIIAAFYILFAKVGPFLFGGKDDKPDATGSSTSQVDPNPAGSSDPSGSTSANPSGSQTDVTPEPPASNVTSIQLDRTDFTLDPNQNVTLKATVVPQDAGKITWKSDHPEALTVSDDGVVTNVNTGAKKVKVTVTASIGDKTAACTVYCKPGATGAAPQQPDKPDPKPDPKPSTGTVKPGTEAVISGAGTGLKVRSGPGSDFEVVASVQNGNTVIIREDTGKGWYKVDYGNGKTGYVSSSFVKAK